MPASWQVSLVYHPIKGKWTLCWNILKSIWNTFLILVPCRLTKEPSDSNRQNKNTRALQLDLVSDNTYNFQSRFDLLTYKMRVNTQTHSSREIFHTSILWKMSTHENTRKTYNSITKTMTRKLCWYLEFIYSLNKSSYKCAGCKENSPQEVHWSLTTMFCGRSNCSSSDSIVESVSELASLS